MKKKIAIAALILGFVSCSKVPISGRRQMNMLPESELMTMSFSNYTQFLKEHKVVPETDERAKMVKSIGEKMAKSVESFLTKTKKSKRFKGFKWEFNLVDDPTVNAWCMPGGKVVVYTGLLPVTQDEASLAVVMGHEIAHAIARHGNERMSQQLLLQVGGTALGAALSTKPEMTQNIFNMSYGLGSQLGVLAYSRGHESEADKMGLVFMAMSGYDPEVAVGFWQRMAQASGGQQTPEMLRTHPSDDKRIAEIKEFLPIAKAYMNLPK